jgi:hypothetical protein
VVSLRFRVLEDFDGVSAARVAHEHQGSLLGGIVAGDLAPLELLASENEAEATERYRLRR